VKHRWGPPLTLGYLSAAVRQLEALHPDLGITRGDGKLGGVVYFYTVRVLLKKNPGNNPSRRPKSTPVQLNNFNQINAHYFHCRSKNFLKLPIQYRYRNQ
jgi:hypothetical protein